LDSPPEIRARRDRGAEQSHNSTYGGPRKTLMRQHRSALYTEAWTTRKENVTFLVINI
jgi:hypothetical protein